MECTNKQAWKYQRRDLKRSRAIENSKKHKGKVIELSKKNIYIVTGEKLDGEEFEVKINGTRFIGDPKEFKEIKRMCQKELKAKVRILQIVSG